MSDRRDRQRRLAKMVQRIDGMIADRLLRRDELAEACRDHGVDPSDDLIDMLDAHQQSEVERGIRPGNAAGAATALVALVGRMSDAERRESARAAIMMGL